MAFLNILDGGNEGILLDHYDFSDLLGEGNNVPSCCSIDETNSISLREIHMDGMAFLNILDRVQKIRNELTYKLEGSKFSSPKIGTSSSLKLIESLADRSSRALERLYNFLLVHLGLLETVVNNDLTSNKNHSD